MREQKNKNNPFDIIRSGKPNDDHDRRIDLGEYNKSNSNTKLLGENLKFTYKCTQNINVLISISQQSFIHSVLKKIRYQGSKYNIFIVSQLHYNLRS